MSSEPTNAASGGIYLADSDASWRARFEQERDRLLAVQGSSIADIEHYGSTAIPHLIAKPIIDMMAPVNSLNDGHRRGELYSDLGYKLVKADFSKRVLFRREDAPSGLAYHLHLAVCPDWPVKNELLFRDWLTLHPDAVAEYAALKRRLAQECGGDMQRYTFGKSTFVRRIVSMARDAAGLPPETDWSE